MKNLNFKNCSLRNLRQEEKKVTNGGIPWLFNWRIYRPETYYPNYEDQKV